MARSSTNLHHILFGNVLAVSDSDLIETFIVLAVVVIFVILFFKELQITSFDNTFAKSYGLNTSVIHYGLMIVLTLVTVSALQTVGIILIVAMLITPAATAFLWTNRLVYMLFVSSGVGAIASIVGLISYTRIIWSPVLESLLVATLSSLIALLFPSS